MARGAIILSISVKGRAIMSVCLSEDQLTSRSCYRITWPSPFCCNIYIACQPRPRGFSLEKWVGLFPPHPFFKGKALGTRLIACVAWRFCRAGHTSGEAARKSCSRPNRRPPLLLSAANQNRHATQAITYSIPLTTANALCIVKTVYQCKCRKSVTDFP